MWILGLHGSYGPEGAHTPIAVMSPWLLGLIRCTLIVTSRDSFPGHFQVQQARMINGIKKKAVEGSTGVP